MPILVYRGCFMSSDHPVPTTHVMTDPTEKPDVGSVIRLSEMYDINEEMHDRLKELGLKAVPHKNLPNYVEVVEFGSVQCYKCGCWYMPTQAQLDRFVANDCIYEPTDFECTSCKAAEQEIPIGADEPDYVKHNYCQVHGVYHSCSLNWPA